MQAVKCKVFPDDKPRTGNGSNGPYHRQRIYVEVETGRPMQEIQIYVPDAAGYAAGDYVLAPESLVVRQGKLSIAPKLAPAK